MTREDFEAIHLFAQEPCECPDGITLICSEVPGAACTACQARKWMEDGKKLAEELS